MLPRYRLIKKLCYVLTFVFIVTCVIYAPTLTRSQSNPLLDALNALVSLQKELAGLDRSIPQLETDIDNAREKVLQYTTSAAWAQAAINSCDTRISRNKDRIRVLSGEIRTIRDDIEVHTWNIEWIDSWLALNGNSPSPSTQQEAERYRQERSNRIQSRSNLYGDKLSKEQEKTRLLVEIGTLSSDKISYIGDRDSAERNLSSAQSRLTTLEGQLSWKRSRRAALPGLIQAAQTLYDQLKAQQQNTGN